MGDICRIFKSGHCAFELIFNETKKNGGDMVHQAISAWQDRVTAVSPIYQISIYFSTKSTAKTYIRMLIFFFFALPVTTLINT